ncbi:glycine-rich domain-containing protein-like [Candidatus Saccharibacteria bacterium]|nr:glycine-rich domain-containing protein-like [Candidatus Saccharibacteria bacterium]
MSTHTIELPELSVDLVEKAKRSTGPLADMDEESLKVIERRYRQFLALARDHRDVNLVPTREIDEMWHVHMLCPVAYFDDCTQIAGQIMDHDGGFGRADGEVEEWRRQWNETSAIWEREFQESYGPDMMTCDNGWGRMLPRS